MEIKTYKLKDLIPADYNPRTITDEALEGLKSSIEKFGYLQPVIVNIHSGKPVIVGGHQRVKAMLAQGMNDAKCIVVDFDEFKEKAANVALNSESISGDWDVMKLESVLKDLEIDFPDYEKLNFDGLKSQVGIYDFDGDIAVKENKEIDTDAFGSTLKHQCPKCGFEFDDD